MLFAVSSAGVLIYSVLVTGLDNGVRAILALASVIATATCISFAFSAQLNNSEPYRRIRAEILQSTFSDMIQQYGITTMSKVITPREIRFLFLREFNQTQPEEKSSKSQFVESHSASLLHVGAFLEDELKELSKAYGYKESLIAELDRKLERMNTAVAEQAEASNRNPDDIRRETGFFRMADLIQTEKERIAALYSEEVSWIVDHTEADHIADEILPLEYEKYRL
eukprot:TRINITY_DN22390_c0_g1_i1.p1 TRINITY_DN22390_c0_g1~~TRINITY_DN22390_c0_g1_i1.p1  ORF type:complete len:225 (-),score=51.10 TRINITY_DN22390_c0_g1_i1:84-758(-)